MKLNKKLLSTTVIAFLAIQAFSFEAVVKSVTGRVEIKDGSEWFQVEEGETLEEGTIISTGYKSSVVISVKSSEFELGPLARLTLEELISTDSKDSVQLYLDSGTISASVSNEDGKTVGFKTRSPVATASVRGTSFRYSADGTLFVLKGLTALGPAEAKHLRGTQNVKKGKSNIFTSTRAVGAAQGIPVYAGQSSSTNDFTLERSSPEEEAIKLIGINTTGTTTSSAAESESSGTGNTTSKDNEAVSGNGGGEPVVSIVFTF